MAFNGPDERFIFRDYIQPLPKRTQLNEAKEIEGWRYSMKQIYQVTLRAFQGELRVVF